MKLVLKYVLFAAMATVMNIATQELFVRAYSGSFNLLASIAAGTPIGGFKTAIFRVFNFGFSAAFADKNMRWTALGYFIKYRIAKHFVFEVQGA
jgi:hypothetical protein